MRERGVRGYRLNQDAPFEITSERARQVAEANRRKAIEGLSQINGLLRGMLDIDYGIVVAAMGADEAHIWATKAATQSRSLKTIERKLREAVENDN